MDSSTKGSKQMKSKITIETNYNGFKTTTRTIDRIVKFDATGTPYCKINGIVEFLEADEWNGKPNGDYLIYRQVNY